MSSPSPKTILDRCVEQRTELRFSGETWTGRMERVLDRTLRVACSGVDEAAQPLPGHMVCCDFNHGPRSGAFFARVVDWIRDDGKTVLVLERPTQILYVDVRRAFRVPTRQAPLNASVQGLLDHDGPVLDMSRVGLCVEANGSGLERGDFVRLTLEYRGRGLELMARVAVATDDRIGLCLTEPSDAYRDLVNALERDWMRRNSSRMSA